MRLIYALALVALLGGCASSLPPANPLDPRVQIRVDSLRSLDSSTLSQADREAS
jgi:hypothetical protein